MTGVSVKYLRRTGWDRSRFLQAIFQKLSKSSKSYETMVKE